MSRLFDSRVTDRFLVKIAWPSQLTACWPWMARIDRYGYGHFFMFRAKHLAHRVAYEMFVEPIPGALDIDHLCRVRRCVNPLHMQPVTRRENTRRGTSLSVINSAKTHCHNGHEFNDVNTYRYQERARICRQCARQRAARRKSEVA